MSRDRHSGSLGRLWRRNGLIWLSLLLLLILTLALGYAPLGRVTTVAGLLIAVAKAAIVVVLFMELAEAKPLVRLAALAGIMFLLVLFALTLTDTLDRIAVG